MRKKIAILVGIAVCAILLTAPALASAGYSKIYGNANEDDVLDMRDVTYIKLVIFGKKPTTTFADANYDGKVSMLDIGQTKLIIMGKEKKLTLIDMADRTVTIPRPIEGVVSNSPDAIKVIIALGECDKLVGVASLSGICYHPTHSAGERAELCAANVCGGRLYELPDVGFSLVNVELVVSLKPDVILTRRQADRANTIQEQTDIPVVCFRSYGHQFTEMDKIDKSIELIGTIFNKEKESEELISFVREKVDKLEKVTSQIPEEEKPRVYYARGITSASGTSGNYGLTRTITRYDPIDIAGGMNVAKDVPLQRPGGATTVAVAKEQIIAWNPDIIVVNMGGVVDKSDLGPLLADRDLQTVNALVNKRVYFTIPPYNVRPHDRNLVATFYLAKCFHPDKFEDLDVEEEGNEIFKAFLGVDGLFSEYADYLGWMREWLDEQQKS